MRDGREFFFQGFFFFFRCVMVVVRSRESIFFSFFSRFSPSQAIPFPLHARDRQRKLYIVLTGAEYSGKEHVASRLPSSTSAAKRDDDGALFVSPPPTQLPPPTSASARSWARSWAMRAETSSRENEAAADGAISCLCVFRFPRKKREKSESDFSFSFSTESKLERRRRRRQTASFFVLRPPHRNSSVAKSSALFPQLQQEREHLDTERDAVPQRRQHGAARERE